MFNKLQPKALAENRKPTVKPVSDDAIYAPDTSLASLITHGVIGNQAAQRLLNHQPTGASQFIARRLSPSDLQRTISKEFVGTGGYFTSSPQITGNKQPNYNRTAVLQRIKDYIQTDTTISTRGMTFTQEYQLCHPLAGSSTAELELNFNQINALITQAETDTSVKLGLFTPKITRLRELINSVQANPFAHAENSVQAKRALLEKLYADNNWKPQITTPWYNGKEIHNDTGFELLAMLNVRFNGALVGVIHIHYKRDISPQHIDESDISRIHFKLKHDAGAPNSLIKQADLITASQTVAEANPTGYVFEGQRVFTV